MNPEQAEDLNGRPHGHLRQLTGLRFLAAAAVISSHAYQRGLIEMPPWLYLGLDGGRTAVTFFFVLSGFILAFTYRKFESKRDIKSFYVKRFARIYPVVLISLAVALMAFPFAVSRPDLIMSWYSLSDGWHLWLPISFIAQLLMLTAWLPSARLNQPWDSPAWSVSCEVFFYATFPLILKWLDSLKIRGLLITASLAWISQALILTGLKLLPESGSKGFLISQFPITHLAEFILGVIAARVFLLHGDSIFRSKRYLLLFQASSIFLIAMISSIRPFEPAYFLLSPLFALVIMSFARPPVLKIGLDSRLMVLLGESSYALYMVHIPLVHIWQIASEAISLPKPLFILVAIGISILIYKYFEKPFRPRIVRKMLDKLAA